MQISQDFHLRCGRGILALGVALGLALATPAFAQSHDGGTHEGGDGHEDGAGGGPKGPGGGGHDNGGHDDGGHDTGGHDNGGKGAGGAGPQGGAGGLGKRSGQNDAAQSRPVWAQEGIPEVELGRLNVVRSPAKVIDRAMAEAIGSFTDEVAAFYRLDLEEMEARLRSDWQNVALIDSPLQNLALFRDALDGHSVLEKAGIRTDNDTLLAAFLGTASDKTVPVSTKTAIAVSTILGFPLSESEAEAIAEKAERIRAAILAGHG